MLLDAFHNFLLSKEQHLGLKIERFDHSEWLLKKKTGIPECRLVTLELAPAEIWAGSGLVAPASSWRRLIHIGAKIDPVVAGEPVRA